MNRFDTASRISRHLLWVAVFALLVGGVAFYLREHLQPFFLTRPSINGLILGLGLVGFFLCVNQLLHLYRQARTMGSLAASLAGDQAGAIEQAVERINAGIVKDRALSTLGLMRRGVANTQALGLISDADVDSEESRGAFVRYVLGVMVFLGLIGTFWGVLITVGGVQKVLEALEPSRVDDPIAFVTQLKSSMGGLLGGLATAFSTSLFGLTGSVLLGFVDLQTRKARSQLLGDLDRFVVSVLVPVASEKVLQPGMALARMPEESKGDEIYHLASQEALGENLRKLTEVIAHRSAMDEKTADAIVEVKGIIEALREENIRTREAAQSANLARQGLLERVDNLSKHMERLVKEMRLSREAADDAGRALLDRMKLEGEITNKTLSMGFTDIIRNLDRLREGRGKRGDPEEDGRS